MRKGKKLPIKNLTLRALAATGAISIALLAPKMTKLFKHFDRSKVNRDNLYRRISQASTRLEKEGLITISGRFRERKISLTAKGREAIESAEFDEYEIPEPAFWDGKWRILMFDLNEKRRPVRDKLRRLLQSAGFVRLQDSVWIYPYPCDEFITLVRAHLKSGVGELRSLTADALESDGPLRAHFKL
jgi:DNA-binding transcriptional regulator PaaX